MAAGDIDGDGDLDIITANLQSASVLLGFGDGTFGPASLTRFGGFEEPYDDTRAIALGDLDNDGDLDIVLADSPHVVFALLGAGDGTFALGPGARSASAPVGQAYEAALADFDGDGVLDLVLVSIGSLDVELTLYDGDGTGGFVFSEVLLVEFEFPFRAGLAVGDFDGDGTPDVAVANGGTKVAVALNDGAGGLLAPTVYTPPGPGSNHTHDVVAADFDGDGDLDLSTPSHVLLNRGSGTFAPAQTGTDTTERLSSSVDASDFDLDGAIDIAFEGTFIRPGGDTVGAVRVARGQGDGSLFPSEPIYPPLSSSDVFVTQGLAAEDLNGDARPDLIYAAVQDGASGVAVLLTPPPPPPIFLPVVETIGVTDTPGLLPALRLLVAETVGVTDAPTLSPALLLAIQETIGVVDDPALAAALRLLVQEQIAVTDAVGAVLEVEGLLDALDDAVADLLEDGLLSGGEARSLLRKLDQIRRQAADGKYRTALNQINAFVRQVESFRDDGVLTAEQADALVAAARALATALEREQAGTQTEALATAEATAELQALPTEFALSPAYPNPFGRTTTIPYALPEDARVRLEIYDALGRRVGVLVDREQPAGHYVAQLRGDALATGTYVVRLVAGPFTATGTVQVAR